MIALGVLLAFQFFIPKSPFLKQERGIFTVAAGESESAIAQNLRGRGIIKSSFFFRLYVIATGRHGKLQAGSYRVSSRMSAAEIARMMAEGRTAKDYLTIIEGWTLKDIARELEKRNLSSQKDFLAATKGREGYLFPDTYELSPKNEPAHLIGRALANFDKKISSELRQEIAAQKKTLAQIITMASILEKEANNSNDKKIISGILWKRIVHGMPLQADATVNYVTGKNDPKVSLRDAAIDSPYNTYKYYGLPPGPISNPGLDSILAAIRPLKTDYWYYLSADGTGETIYSRTFAEHQEAMKKHFNP